MPLLPITQVILVLKTILMEQGVEYEYKVQLSTDNI